MILAFSQSEKLKVSANGLRALGFLLATANLPEVLDDKGKTENLAGKIRLTIHSSLRNKSPKVSWNACIVVAKTIANESLELCSIDSTKNMFFDWTTVKLLIEIVASRPNIKARIQACKALLAYKSLYDMGGGSTQALVDTFDAVIVCMGYKTHFVGSTAELKYLDDFEDVVLDLWLSASEMLIASTQNDAADKTV